MAAQHDVRRPAGIPFIFDRQLMLALPSAPGHSRRIRFLRASGLDFDDNDRAVAALARPHLVAHLHALDLMSRGITPLTTRQRHLLSLVAAGYSNSQVARTLGISAQTVRTHLQQIYVRLGVNSRGEAAALISPPGTLAPIGPPGRFSPARLRGDQEVPGIVDRPSPNRSGHASS